MSKTVDRRKRKKATQRKQHLKEVHEASVPTTPDGTYYFCIAMVAGFSYGIWWVIAPDLGREGFGAIMIGLVLLTNLYAFQAYRGTEVLGWRGALARIPLRFAGFGPQGHPLEAAHGRAAAKKAIIACALISVVLVALLLWWIVPGLLEQ